MNHDSAFVTVPLESGSEVRWQGGGTDPPRTLEGLPKYDWQIWDTE
jgi:hypothetical protein